MIYDLGSNPSWFKHVDAVVRAVLAQGRPEYRTHRLVTSDTAKLQPENQLYIENNPTVLGVCFGHDGNSVFDVWINPSFTDFSTAFFQDTVIHELVHGYTGNYEHNYRFKRFLGRCLIHYSDLVSPLADDVLLKNSLYRYTRMNLSEGPDQYDLRIHNESESIFKVAAQEADLVAMSYHEILMREGVDDRQYV